MANVTIYTTPTCGYCKMAKLFFKQHNVQYIEHDVTTDEKAREQMLELSGQMGVPVTDVDGKIVVGFDQSALSKLLGIA